MDDQTETINIAEVRQKVFHAEQMLSQTDVAAMQRIRAVVVAGEVLLKVKDGMKHGEWGPWVKLNLEGISHETACRWMKLHAFHLANGDEIFDDAKSVRQAYKLAGIIPEVSSAGTSRASATVDYVLHFHRAELALRKMDPGTMSPEDKAAFRGRWETLGREAARLLV